MLQTKIMFVAPKLHGIEILQTDGSVDTERFFCAHGAERFPPCVETPYDCEALSGGAEALSYDDGYERLHCRTTVLGSLTKCYYRRVDVRLPNSFSPPAQGIPNTRRTIPKVCYRSVAIRVVPLRTPTEKRTA